MTWTVPWAMWTWGLLFALVILFEVVTLVWNELYGDGRRANLTAYVRAYFGIGDRQLKRRGRPAVMVAFLVWLTGHFMGWWG